MRRRRGVTTGAEVIPSREGTGVLRWATVVVRLRRLAALQVAIALAVVAAPVAAAPAAASLDQATALRAEGRLDEALDLLREESRKIKRADGDESPLLLPINDLAIDILAEQGSAEAAEALLTKVVDARRKLVADKQAVHEAGLVRSLIKLSRMHVAAKRFSEALATTSEALVIADRGDDPRGSEAELARTAVESTIDAIAAFVGPADPTTLAARAAAAQQYESLGFLEEAIGHRSQIVAATMARAGGPGSDGMQEVDRLCQDMRAAGRAGDGVPILAGVLAKAAAPASPQALEARRLLGELQRADGQFIAAASTYEAILEAGRGVKGFSAVAAAADRIHAAVVDAERRDSPTPPDWLQAELDLLTRAPPADRPAAVDALMTAAELFTLLDQPKAAADQLGRAISLENSLKPPSPQRLADLAGHLAAAHLATDDPAAARKVSEPALLAAEKALGPGAAATSFLRVVLAEALRREGRAEAARPLLRQAIARGIPRPDDTREDMIVGIVDGFAAADPEQTFREDFIAARSRQFGAEHRNVGLAWSMFGAGRLADGEWRAAADDLAKAVSILSTSLGAEHPETAASRSLLAHAERLAGDPRRAAATAAEALATWERLAGPDHSGTLTTADVLVSARLQLGDTTGVEELLVRLCGSNDVFTAVQRAGHLVRLAVLTAGHDKPLALQRLQRAMALPCWRLEESIREQDRDTLAVTAARAAFAYNLLGDRAQGEDALRKARSLALKAADSQRLLATIEKIAAAGDRSAP